MYNEVAGLSSIAAVLALGAGLLPGLKEANSKALKTLSAATTHSIGAPDEASRGGVCLRFSPLLFYTQPLRKRDVEDCVGRLSLEMDLPGMDRAEFEALIDRLPNAASIAGIEAATSTAAPNAVDATWCALSGGSSCVSAQEIERQLRRWRPEPGTFVLAEYERSVLQGRANICAGYATLFGLQGLVLWLFVLQPVSDALRLRGGARIEPLFAWADANKARLHVGARRRTSTRRSSAFLSTSWRAGLPRMLTDGGAEMDRAVLAGDTASLLGYGAVQSLVDDALSPLAAKSPELFTQADSLAAPIFQAAVLAATWATIGTALGCYQRRLTRPADSPGLALLAAVPPWLGSCALLLGALALLRSQLGVGPGASQAELDFFLGSATVVGGWRFVVATALPR